MSISGRTSSQTKNVVRSCVKFIPVKREIARELKKEKEMR